MNDWRAKFRVMFVEICILAKGSECSSWMQDPTLQKVIRIWGNFILLLLIDIKQINFHQIGDNKLKMKSIPNIGKSHIHIVRYKTYNNKIVK